MAPSWIRWTLAVGLGLAVGFGVAAAITVLVAAQVTGDATWAAATPIWIAAIIGGVIQGVILGFLQFALLRSWVPALRALPWVIATAGVAAAGWAVAIGYQLAATINETTEVLTVDELDAARGLNWPAAIIGVVGGALIGAAFGLTQGHLLRRHLPRARMWVPANMVAWAAGFAFLIILLSTPEAGWPISAIVILAAFAFLIAGLAIGATTGRFLPYLDDASGSTGATPEPEATA